MVYTQANDISTGEKKTIINPDHVMEALKQLGLTAWVPEVQEAWDGHKATVSKGVLESFIIFVGPRARNRHLSKECFLGWNV